MGATRTNGGWALETSLDVEWVHAIAPGANILLVEAKSASTTDLLNAIDYASSQAGVVAVSNSWGGGETSTEASLDSHFQHSGIVYLASSGDNGAGVEWPAASPYVLSVGGTTLNLSGSTYVSETGWSGSGGGISAYESDTYQFGTNSKRNVPDVSWDADPNTGVAVYDSTPDNGQAGWFQVGGTSFGSPCWAGLVALADQANGKFSNSINAITKLYSLTSDFHDITSGSNGTYTAKAGYDNVTGIGSPVVNNLISVWHN